MHLTIVNLSEHSITASPAPHNGEPKTNIAGDLVLLPSSKITTDWLRGCRTRLFLKSTEEPTSKEWQISPEGLLIRVSMALGASWQVINVPEGCPWRIFCSRITRKHHRLLILPRRSMASFLSEMPDELPLSSLMLPGTHDTMAFYGWPISQCQSPETPLSFQLLSGIRVIDVRLAIIKGRLIAYHGAFPQRTPFQAILTSIHAFLTCPTTCDETIVMSIKQEDFPIHGVPLFSRLVREEIERGPGGMDMWFLRNRVPKLGEVRGKIVMLSRFGGNGDGWEGGLEGLGIHPTKWPDSEKWGFSWQCKNTLVRTHDWYSIPSFLSIPEKTALATQILLPPKAPNPEPPIPTLAITFFSAASFPLAAPPTVAQGFGWPKWGFGVEGVNSRVGKWVLDMLGEDNEQEPRIRGWALMDYFDHPEEGGLVPLLVECNFRGRKPGEEGW